MAADPVSRRAPEALLPRVAAGDPDAVRALVAAYGDLVWSLARRFDPANAEDAVQEIFVDLWKSAERFDAAIASETTFVAMIARRRLIDRRRLQQRRPVLDGVDELPAVIDDAASADTAVDAATAISALDRLRPEQRHVLLLATGRGMSHGEIAEQTGMPLGTVKAHARRGLLAIRVALFGSSPKDQP